MVTRNLFIILACSLALSSCREDDTLTPEPQPIKFHGTLISHKHGNNTVIHDTMFNRILRNTILGDDSFVTISIFVPQLDSTFTSEFVPAVSLSEDHSKILKGGDDCIWEFIQATDLKSVAYHITAICEPGTDYFFEGTKQ